jgi:predicted mannosyl-3-phosphoglycerate phosphatase (HAD superfamily)
MKKKKMKKTRAELERKILELKSSSVVAHHIAHRCVEDASIGKMMASGVLLQLSSLGGRDIVTVCIGDGLSDETIECLKKDIKRSQDLDLVYKL